MNTPAEGISHRKAPSGRTAPKSSVNIDDSKNNKINNNKDSLVSSLFYMNYYSDDSRARVLMCLRS